MWLNLLHRIYILPAANEKFFLLIIILWQISQFFFYSKQVLQLANCIEHHDDDDNENIYEPVNHIKKTIKFLYRKSSWLIFISSLQINIPDISPKSPLWRYFSKINIETLVEITRWKKENKDEHSNAFSDIRKRFGHHRKSIKNRMKKFYNRSDTDRCEKCPNDSNEDLGSQGASCSSASDSGGRSSSENNSEKGSFVMNRVEAFRKRDRHLFGSIGLLKKSRTPASLEEVTPRKKIIVAAKTNFPQELKKKTNKGFIEKVSGCFN